MTSAEIRTARGRSRALRGLGAAITAVFFNLHPCAAYAQTETLEEADRLAAQGSTAEALRTYEKLIADLPVSPALFSAFDGYFRFEPDLDCILRVSDSLLSRTKGTDLPPGLAAKIARLYELSGRTDEARALYQKEPGSRDAFDSAVRLMLEMNETDEAAALLASKPEADNGVLAGQAALQRGDASAARLFFKKALENPGEEGDSIRAMFGLYAAAAAEGDSKGMEEAAARLTKVFPLSPEAAITRDPARATGTPDARIRTATVPARYFGARDVAELSSKEPAAGATEAGRVSVQAGSYAMRENAEDMKNVLTGKGFSASIRESEGSGRKLFRVFAAESIGPEDAKNVVLMLQKNGLYGFIVPERE
jgi:tetratricopeptide (TPR) repeat protein